MSQRVDGRHCDPWAEISSCRWLSKRAHTACASVTGRKWGRKGVCVLSGFLPSRFTDQNERRVWRVCSLWVFVVAVALPALVVYASTQLLWEKKKEEEAEKEHARSSFRAVDHALAFLWPWAWEPQCDCSLSMWLCFRCFSSFREESEGASMFQSELSSAAELHAHENTLCNNESTSDMVRGSTISGFGNPHLTTSVSKCSLHHSGTAVALTLSWRAKLRTLN